MAFVRRIAAPGLQNCRDLGGFAAEGGVTKFGVFLRSEAPCDLPETGIQALKDYGVAVSFDLRGEPEIQWRPSALEGLLPYRKISLSGGAETFDKNNLPEGDFSWDKVYIRRAEAHKDWFREAVTACAEAEGCALYHCTTGKDRTGILTCCLLGAVGVSREDIAADYCLSQVYLQDMFAAMRDGSLTIRPGPSHFEEYVFQTPFTAMTAFYDYLSETYGGVAGYLRHIGVTEETLRQLKEKFVQTEDRNMEEYKEKQELPGKSEAIVSLVTGILALCCCGAAPWFGFILGIVGLIFAGIAKRQGNRSGIRTGGFVTALLGLIFSCLTGIIALVAGSFLVAFGTGMLHEVIQGILL